MPKVGMEPIRRKQVMDAVLTCIVEDGLEYVTLDKAASRAGVSKGVVAYYFNNKKNLLLESCKYFFENYTSSIESFFTSSSDVPKMRDALLVIGKITLGIHEDDKYKPSYLEKNAGKIILQIYSKIATDEDFTGVYQEIYTSYFDGILKIIEYGQDQNEWHIKDHKATTIHIMALLEGMAILSSTGFYQDKLSQLHIYQEFINSL